MSILLQDSDGNWHYFSFVSARSNAITVDVLVYEIFRHGVLGSVRGDVTHIALDNAADYDLSTYDGLIQILSDSNKIPVTVGRIDTAIYIEGDFSNSCAEAIQTKDKLWAYNLLGYNCMDYALDLLSKGEDLTCYQKLLIAAIKMSKAIPKNSVDHLSSLGEVLK